MLYPVLVSNFAFRIYVDDDDDDDDKVTDV